MVNLTSRLGGVYMVTLGRRLGGVSMVTHIRLRDVFWSLLRGGWEKSEHSLL